MAKVRALLRREEQSASAPPVLETGGLRADRALRQVYVDGKSVHLTKKEYELLNLLVAGAGRVLTHQHILTAIWGEEHRTQTHHLRVLDQQLRQKLGDEPTDPRFIVTVQGVGYRLVLPELQDHSGL